MYPEKLSLVFGATDTVKTDTFKSFIGTSQDESLLHSIEITIPDWTTGTPTLTFAIVNAASKTVYSISGLAENITHILLVDRPIGNGYSISGTLSGQPGGSGGTIDIVTHLTDYINV